MVSIVKKLLPGAAGTAGAGGGDDDFNLVSSLFHFDGSNGGQNNTVIDSSDNNLTVTTNGTAGQTPFSPFTVDVGKWSTYFDGGAHLLWTASQFQFGTADYTLECFFHLTGNGTQGGGIFQSGNGGTGSPALAQRDTTGLTIYTSSGQKSTGNTGLLQLGVWYHIAMVRASNVIRVYVDGALVTWSDGTTTAADTTNVTSTAMVVGKYYSDSYRFYGYISNVRINKGTAVYTGAFDKPTAPLTDITNTVLIACSTNNYLFERSSINMAITNTYGTARVKPFSPFKNDATYDPAVHGGSLYFSQHTTSWASVSHATLFDFGTADYCIEAWLYPVQTSYNTSWAMWASTIGVNQYWAYTDGGGNSTYAGYSSYPAGGYSGQNWHQVNPYVWTHVVFQNTGGYENWYKNGTRIYNVQNNPNHGSSATGMMFGRANNYASNYFYGGYLSDIRVTTGANYNPYSNASTLTVPTAPLTKGNYTRLLLNGTNAAAVNSTGKESLTTYGNAQLNTSVKKFGTASMKFDETGDYSMIAHPPMLIPLTGDFTIEGWVYFLAAATNGQGLFQFDTGGLNSRDGKGPALGTYNGTGKWHIYYGMEGDSARSNTVGSAVAAPSVNTWYHFAYVQSGGNTGNIKVYIDGTQIGNTIAYGGDYKAHNNLVIGGWYSGSYLLNGYIDDFRITHKARYTSNFDVPTAAHPDI